ncbi:hypothetical protein DM01DRAFT_1409318 [Hesseltinella vesiculosa]|uniref:Uncharacterized protein n=1 Tax=Hesseltinella vesiculosa TaxID=101127 RepID=A0A1X2GBI4_9FUNG|nr:hypothetical protein DM01DRAFT_1409318 [Hesseltinella vesiculosa]
MSKKQPTDDSIYTYISPAFTSPSGPSTRSTIQPSAPSAQAPDNQGYAQLPSYEDAIAEHFPLTAAIALPNADLDGYIRDESLALPPSNTHPFQPRVPAIPHTPALASASASSQPNATIAMTTLDDYDLEHDDDSDQTALLPKDQPQEALSQIHDAGPNFDGRPFPPSYSIYTASYEVKREGVSSRDVHLNTDPEALVQFFKQHNLPPRMKIKFLGYHEEIKHSKKRHHHHHHRHWKKKKEAVKTERVVDFEFALDCSDYINTTCVGIFVPPHPKTNVIQSLHDVCKDYVQSDSKLKNLRLSKQIQWNYGELTQALMAAIRRNGYKNSLHITFEMENYSIDVKTDSTFSKLVDNAFMQFLCLITCLFTLTLPYIWYDRQKFGQRTLKSQWTMKVTEQQWYEGHLEQILAKIDRPNTTPLKAFTNLVTSLFNNN